MTSVKTMVAEAAGATALAAVTLTGIAVVTGYKDTGQVDNSTADNFITGLAVFGSFMTVIALTIVGRIVIRLIKGTN